MPYPVELSAVLEVIARMTVDNQECMTVLHYQYDSGSSIPDGKAAAADFLNKIRIAGGLKDKYVACISQEVNDLTWRAQWITPKRYRYVHLALPSDNGMVAADTLPVQVSVAITKQAQAANRHGQGTTHMPAVPTTFVENSTVTLPGMIAYTELCSKLIQPVVLTGGQVMNPVLFWRTNPIMSETIEQAFPQQTSRVNRRRTVGLGS